MQHRLRELLRQGLAQLQGLTTRLRITGLRLWRAHLARLKQSPVYETLLLALIDLALGHRVDLHQFLMRIMTRLQRNPAEVSDSDGWAY